MNLHTDDALRLSNDHLERLRRDAGVPTTRRRPRLGSGSPRRKPANGTPDE